MRKIILGLLLLSALLSVGQLLLQILEHQNHKGEFKPSNLGDQFKGLEALFFQVHIAGYYTDKNIDEPLTIAQFEQAQYVLAPTILDLNHTNYSLVIFDCSSPEAALNKIKALGFQPIKANNLGVVLAFNPQAAKP